MESNLTALLYLSNLFMLIAGFLSLRLKSEERKLAFSLIRSLGCLPVLVAGYVHFGHSPTASVLSVVMFSEVLLSCAWLLMSLRLYQVALGAGIAVKPHSLVEAVLMAGLLGGLVALIFHPPHVRTGDGFLSFDLGGTVYFASLLVIFGMLATAWRMEAFWRILPSASRWQYKFFLVGSYLVCGTMIWTASYRVTYLRIVADHITLLTFLLSFAWILVCYAVARHRLLNRRIFVSRKVVYSSVAPTVLGLYLFSLGFASLLVKNLGWSLSDTVLWMGITLGLVAVVLFLLSGKLRRRVHFFISTHFYINKYEYRDEWLALSKLLQGTFSALEIARALALVLADSLYTANIRIWLGDEESGYDAVPMGEQEAGASSQAHVAKELPLVAYLKTHDHLYLEEKEVEAEERPLLDSTRELFRSMGLVLFTPLSAGGKLIGFVGIGAEFTGGRYGKDDYDLLIALGSQAASSLLAVKMGEELARARQREVWENLSHFVLHDLKNSATMLSLIRQNADDHVQDPEFQSDMLEAIDDALRRMNRVQDRLTAFSSEITPTWQKVEARDFLKNFAGEMAKKLMGLKISHACGNNLEMFSDPDFLSQVLENLLINSIESGGPGTEVHL
ncbi:MAG: hypothetical protein HGA63_05285, partial [Syntrophobacteraceae bacterium]|nr:hypothetical protein [Syntrophobacteraceae bacterium]